MIYECFSTTLYFGETFYLCQKSLEHFLGHPLFAQCEVLAKRSIEKNPKNACIEFYLKTAQNSLLYLNLKLLTNRECQWINEGNE